MDTDTSEITGETSERQGWIATALTFLCPGLGYMYVGRLGRGLLYNGLFVAAFVAAIAVVTVYRVFPLWPFLVLVVGWLAISWLVSRSVREIIDDTSDFQTRSYNHWTVYSVVALLTYVLPLAAAAAYTHQFLWTLHTVRDAAMYPNLLPGDVVLVERRTYEERLPERGELVAFAHDTSASAVRRSVGRPGDRLRVEGHVLHVGGQKRPQAPLQTASIVARTSRLPTEPFELMVEKHRRRRYVFSIVPAARFETGYHSTRLSSDQLYLLADNRTKRSGPFASTQIRDSRDFGPVPADALRGKPLYVAWSSSSASGVRWTRIGRRLR